MSSTLGDFLVNELVYLPSATDEALPWTQRQRLLSEYRQQQEACTEWIVQLIEQSFQKLLELPVAEALMQTKNRSQDNAHGNLFHDLPHGKSFPDDELVHHLFSDVLHELSIRAHPLSMKSGH